MITNERRIDAFNFVQKEWGNNVLREVERVEKTSMNFDQFLNHCTACGGNWGGMLLTGVRKLYENVWDAIPDDLGVNAFTSICNLLILLEVDPSEN